MLRLSALVAAAAALAGIAMGTGPAQSARAAEPQRTTAAQTGNDVSYPQCGRSLPVRGDIAVVGVNEGTGVTTNPCLRDQLAWGDTRAADGGERLADVYVNTANPGHLASWWPRTDRARAGEDVANPRGACSGAEDAACAYVYGWSIAADDASRRGVSRAGERRWWLDVETMNSWSWNPDANLAVLEGMTDRFRSTGAEVGVYSTMTQWTLITGGGAPAGALAAAPSWRAGAITRGGAAALCGEAPFTPAGRVVMAQWVQGGLDHDVSCVPGVRGSVPTVLGEAAVGSRLVADPGAWGPDDVALTYRWLRDGETIEGATSPAYEPTAADLGAVLRVRVTGTRAESPALTLTSAGTTVSAVQAPSDAPSAPDPAPSGATRQA